MHQLNIKHLLSIQDLSEADLMGIINLAKTFENINEQHVKKVPILKGRTIVNLFFENSTRTRVSFEIAGKRLSADTINISGSASSTSKGETIVDTAKNLMAMNPDVIVVRHNKSGAPALMAKAVTASIVNAGDGTHEHPTQALLDCATILRHKKKLQGLQVAIVGDIDHSRVARSNILALSKLGAKVRLCGPVGLVPESLKRIGGDLTESSVSIHHELASAIDGVDVVMMLRIQNERMGAESPRFANTREYSRYFGLSNRTVSAAKSDAIVMHPGPLNRGVEIMPDIADSGRSVILEQVKLGVAVRMAVLYLLGGGNASE